MREGSLDAPTRHAIAWDDLDFADRTKTAAEMRRIWDICHTCRRCFNLCDAFPRLFDLIDSSATGELDSVAVEDYHKVADACTLCDMCFMTKCPYVPPHEFNVDFPHVMLRYRAVELREKKYRRGSVNSPRPTATDAWLASWRRSPIGQTTEGMRRLGQRWRRCWGSTGERRSRAITAAPSSCDRSVRCRRSTTRHQPSAARRSSTRPVSSITAIRILARRPARSSPATGSKPKCCIPGVAVCDLAAVARSACEVAAVLGPRIDKGYDIVALVPSCALMLKFEWPLIVPGNSAVEKLSKATFDNQRVRRRHRSQGRACPRPIAVGGRGCSSPRLPCPRPKYRPKSGRNATVVAWLRHLRDRAVLRPWRALGRAQAKFRDRRQGRGAGRPPSVAERKAVPFLRVSARRHAYPSGDGDGGKRRKPAQTPDASNRTRCPRLRDPRTVV